MIMPLQENMTYCRGKVSGFFLNFALEIFFIGKWKKKNKFFYRWEVIRETVWLI